MPVPQPIAGGVLALAAGMVGVGFDDPSATWLRTTSNLGIPLLGRGPVKSDEGGLPVAGGLTYEPFYGLREKPFSLSSDPRFLYRSPSHAAVFDELLAGIRRREGLSVLTGDIGTGKTTLCRAVLQELDRWTFSAFVPDPFASREDFLKIVLMEFGAISFEDLRNGRLKGASHTDLTYLLYEFLSTLAPLKAFAVVVVDEAQNLSAPLLDEIRILADGSGWNRLLQVILVGQPELHGNLKRPEMRQIDQRVSVRCRLEPLRNADVVAYVAHRLEVAGGTSEHVQFSPGALDVVGRLSGGVPRVINRICDRALCRGSLERMTTIDPATVVAANPDLGPAEAEAQATAPHVSVEREPPAPHPPASERELSSDGDAWLKNVDMGMKVEAHEHADETFDFLMQPAHEMRESRVTRVRPVQTGMPAAKRLKRAIQTLGIVLLLLTVMATLAAGVSYVRTLTDPIVLPDLPSRPAVLMPSLPVPPSPDLSLLL